MAYTTPNHAAYGGQRNPSSYSHTKKDFQTRLQQEVADGQLTSQQEQMIEQKFKSMRQSYGPMKNLSASQRHTDKQQMRSQLQSWAQDNGIPANLL